MTEDPSARPPAAAITFSDLAGALQRIANDAAARIGNEIGLSAKRLKPRKEKQK